MLRRQAQDIRLRTLKTEQTVIAALAALKQHGPMREIRREAREEIERRKKDDGTVDAAQASRNVQVFYQREELKAQLEACRQLRRDVWSMVTGGRHGR